MHLLPPALPKHFEKALKQFDSTLFTKWSGRFWQIWRKAPSGRIHHVLNIERDGRYILPSYFVIDLLKKMDTGNWPGGVTEALNQMDAWNEEKRRHAEQHNDEELYEATKDALWSGAMKELEAL